MNHLPFDRGRARRSTLVAALVLAFAVVAGIGLLAHAATSPGAAGPDRMHRQVGVMEGIIDKVLLDREAAPAPAERGDA